MINRIVAVRMTVRLTSAAACLVFAGCGGGGGNTTPAAGAGNPTNQSLIWDSGEWDNSTWS